MNQKLADLLAGRDNLYPRRLEADHPHVVEKIAQLWGGIALEEYFEGLILDERCSRHGFQPVVMGEIFALRNHYLAQRPQPPRTANTWGQLTDIGDIRLDRGAS